MRYISSLLIILLSCCFVAAFTGCSKGAESQATSSSAAIASAHPLATQAGVDILKQGGNAFDAAVAVAASLGVVEPYSAGIGGGGFWLLYKKETNTYHFIDAREMAPSAAHRDYYLNEDGSVNRDKAINGPTAAGIPGQAAAFVHLAENYGKLPLDQSLAPAIKQAKDGFVIDKHYQMLVGYRLDALQRYDESRNTFLDNAQIPYDNFKVVQKDLAKTLQTLANKGFDGFYSGNIAKKMVEEVQKAGGDWTLEDLANYRVIERDPIDLTLENVRVISAPPPSSGGIALAQMLQMKSLIETDIELTSEADTTHSLVEIMRRAYFDRAEYLGDPDFTPVPINKLLSKEHALKWANSINKSSATPSISLQGSKEVKEGFHTTHLSIVDTEGNRVSATLSINLPFGSAYTVPGTGILLNNEMDDFSAKPGEPNAYGLVGNEANSIAPGKRPLSSMTPTIIETPDSVAILGTPGGSRIISMVYLGVLEYLQGKPVEDWVSKPRFHHQYLPDVIQHEPDTFSDKTRQELEAKGHSLKNIGRKYGNMQAILIDQKTGEVSAASDPRGVGKAVVFQ